MLQTARSLGNLPLFRTLNQEAVQRLDSASSWRRIGAGAWVLDDEADGTDVFFVLQGHVRVIVSTGGVETILRDIHAGEYFGELAALDLKPRSAGILAVTDAVLAAMSAKVFRRAIHDHPDVCDQVLDVLVGQIRMLANRAREGSGLAMKPRLWAELLRLARPPSDDRDVLVISPPPTHAELAARIGSQRETVTRELNALERQGLIARERGATVIVDPKRLGAMVGGAGRR